MSEFKVSAALLRTLPRLMSRADPILDHRFASGAGTKAATHAYQRQGASIAAERVVANSRRTRPLDEKRKKAIARRRKWGGDGNIPDDVRAHYTEAERAALSVIADQCKRRGHCELRLNDIARLAGVGRTSVQNAIRKARSKERAHISVRERRPQRGVISDTNIIKIIGKTWRVWIERALSFKRQGGFKSLNTSETSVKNSLSFDAAPLRMALEGSEGRAPEIVFSPPHQAERSAHGFGWLRGGWECDGRDQGGGRKVKAAEGLDRWVCPRTLPRNC